MQRPTNSPDMSPCNYDFSKIKEPLRSILFESRVDIKIASDRSVRDIAYLELMLQMEYAVFQDLASYYGHGRRLYLNM